MWFPLSPRCPWLRLNTWQPSCLAILVTLFLPAVLSWSPTDVLYTHSLEEVFCTLVLPPPVYLLGKNPKKKQKPKTKSMIFFSAPNKQALCRGLSLRESLALHSPSGNTTVCLPSSWRALPLGLTNHSWYSLPSGKKILEDTVAKRWRVPLKFPIHSTIPMSNKGKN